MQYDQFEYMRFFNIALHKHKAIYFFIPKVACTSLKKTMGEVLGIYQRTWREHLNPFGSPKILNEQYYHWQHYPFVTDATLFDDYFKFTFVRNPWDRLISCYYNKVKKGYSGFRQYGFSPDMDFHDFAMRVCDIPDDQADSHFRSQTNILRSTGKVNMDFIGRLETFNEDFTFVCRKIGLHATPPGRLMRSSRGGTRAEHYSSELAELVGARYQEDIVTFVYRFDDDTTSTRPE